MLEKEFPLLEQIQVKRVYPSTVVVEVKPATPAYAMQTDTGWISLSAGLKILSHRGGAARPAGALRRGAGERDPRRPADLRPVRPRPQR